MTFSEKAINFYLNIIPPKISIDNINVLNPFTNEEVQEIIKNFYEKFFNDNNNRIFLFGINPGRFGGGTTGIPFTDPIALEKELGIENNLQKKPELSCQFIYQLINEFGNPESFYSKYFITALFPLALVKDGLNYNYYDSSEIYISLKDFIKKSFIEQINFGANENFAVSLGKKNMIYLNEVNKELKFFKKIIFLEHPRYIMQYKRKSLKNYIKKYLEILNSI